MSAASPVPPVAYPAGITTDYVDLTGKTLNDPRLAMLPVFNSKFCFCSKPLADRFRALFVLRNLKCDRSVYWIGEALCDSSALLKHELAYCLGQMQNRTALPVLIRTLKNEQQG